MSEAVLSVVHAGPLVTLQDGGRRGYLRYGVSASGPMDPLSFDAANAALGNPPGQTGIEVSLGGLVMTCKSGALSLAVAGGAFTVMLNGQVQPPWSVLSVRGGDRVEVRGGRAGSWAYVAFSGDLDAGEWLGSASTHAPSGLGGGFLASGMRLAIANPTPRDDRLGEIAQPGFLPDGPFGIVPGPQDDRFADGAVDTLLSETFEVSDAYDRMGMRLNGPALCLVDALSIPSEPVLRGAIQVAGDGVPTILLADHQTTGGYPKIATLLSSECGRIAQCRSGDRIRFAAISAEAGLERTRAYLRARADYLAEIAVPRGTLTQRLTRSNLISGAVADDQLPWTA